MSDPTNPYKAPASTEAAASSSSGTATPATRDLLGQAAPWLQFLVVIGYIGLAFIVLAAIAGLFLGTAFGGSGGAVAGPILALVYIIIGLVFYFPLRILGRLTKSSKRYKAQGEAADLETVAGAIRGLAKFYGIATIVIIALYVVIIVGAIAFAPLVTSMFLGQ